MEDFIATAEKKVLVEIVKLSQKRGLKGNTGDWKQFLNSYDKKFGASVSDPSKRSIDILTAFLKTFDKEEDLKVLAQVVQCNSNRQAVNQLLKNFPENESPEQKLVRATLEHPQYPLDYSLPSHEQGWVVTKLGKMSKSTVSNAMVAVDCEMVLCEDGSDALVKVCVVDEKLQVKLDELVNPHKVVADYRTEITGVSAEELDGVTCTLANIQKRLKKLLSDGTILVGHSLNNDLQALRMDHSMVIDTAYLYKYPDAPNKKPSLNNLCQSVLGYEVRKQGSPHNCLDDARAAMKLVLAKMNREVSDILPPIEQNVPEIDLVKLLLHKIPTTVPSEELHNAIPGKFTIELKKTFVKTQRDIYTAFAIFKSSKEAHQAYQKVQGSLEKDSLGRPQKLITFKLSTGVIANMYVREMARDDAQLLSKRALEVEEDSGVNKKQKTGQKVEVVTMEDVNQCCNHLKEIESLKQEHQKASEQCHDHLKVIEGLKQELQNKEFEISALNKIVSKYQGDGKGSKKKGK